MTAPSRKEWLSWFRALLRETSYLPDPIARKYLHERIVNRWHSGLQRNSPETSPEHRENEAKRSIVLLQRANQGYLKQLEKVLCLAYGRTGRRRHQLVGEMMKSPIPANTDEVRRLVKQKRDSPSSPVQEGRPPEVMMALLKSQISNGIVQQSRVRGHPKLDPGIPYADAWGKPLAKARREKLLRQWTTHVLDCLLPPLPECEHALLDGLIAGTVPWKLVERRTPGRPKFWTDSYFWTQKSSPSAKKAHNVLERDLFHHKPDPDPEKVLETVLKHGPSKDRTFEEYASGRPHNITRRFMRRMWMRLAALVPRGTWDAAAEKWHFEWTRPNQISPNMVSELREDIDPKDFFEPLSQRDKLPSEKGGQTGSGQNYIV